MLHDPDFWAGVLVGGCAVILITYAAVAVVQYYIADR